MKTCFLITCIAAVAFAQMDLDLTDLDDLALLPEQPKKAKCGAELNSMSKGAETTFLTEHNRRRTEENKNLTDLVWDDGLARRSQEFANQCVFRHGLLTTCDNKGCGQNVFYSGGIAFNASLAVTAWYNEKADYKYKTNKCKPKKVCGHYTQIVWGNTKKVGCAVTTCTGKIQKYNPEYIVVCDYYPPGNYVNEKPY